MVGIRILLVEMPRMVHDVVEDIVGVEPDLYVVADGVEADALVERVERERPDVVMLWVESASPPAMCEELLSRFPRLAVVALEDRGERGSIYMMRPRRFRVAEISRTRLVTAIRRAARSVPLPASVYDAAAHVAASAGRERGADAGDGNENGAGTARRR